MKKITFLIVLLLAFSFGYGQTKLAELNFETPGGYTTSIPEFTDNARDYFLRTDGNNITGEIFLNKQGDYYFAAQDIDGEGAPIPVTLLINDINISGYNSLEFRIHLAEDDESSNEDWDNLITNNDYVHINYDIDNSSSFNNLIWVESSGTGFNNEPSIDTDFDGTGDGTAITNTFTQFTQSIPGTGSLLDIEIVFRFDAGDEDIAIDNIEVWGVLACSTTTTWTASGWDNGAPTNVSNAIIDADFNTSLGGAQTSFSACSLSVENGATLTIGDNDYIEVENNLIVQTGGNILVQPTGAFIQNNNSAVATNNGTISVAKDTAQLNNWYEYTYWSSPLSNAFVGVALSDSDSDRRFSFNASQFNDALAETGNDDVFVSGQDDIDDEGDDWERVGSTDVMQPGVGYAATHSEIAYVIPGANYRYTFEGGTFNNGVINVPVNRNDTSTADFNWNFIGNPYPSAISISAFITENMYNATTNPTGTLDGTIYFWSQNTDRSSSTNGGETLNFTTSDYATHNGVGGTPGGDGLSPNGSIPSGQGFFVSFSDSAPSNTGNVVFNNSMRSLSLSPDNTQFFKGTKSNKSVSSGNNNKLWVNLTSDNGVFNQILIGYVNGSTDADDGAYYDARKIVAPTTYAALYSTINNSDKKYVIQGKDINSINEDEVINLGFSNTIEVATLFKLSIAQLEGNFLTNNAIYLKDNVLNTLHNLSASDYTFTSEVGEFNDRFEIVFNENILSTEDNVANSNTLKIIELEDDNVKFVASKNIKTVRIFDLLGRQLFQFEGKNTSETFKLSNLSSMVYIAKVELLNGTTITKKAVKK